MKPVQAFAGGAAALAALLCWEVLAVPAAPPDPVPPLAAEQAPVRPATDAVLDNLDGYASTALARPLFRADRRPPNTDVRAAALDDPPRLTGIIIGPAGRRAIFEDPGGRARIAAEGDSLGRFKVAAITPGQVSLTASEGERVLRPSHTKRADK